MGSLQHPSVPVVWEDHTNQVAGVTLGRDVDLHSTRLGQACRVLGRGGVVHRVERATLWDVGGPLNARFSAIGIDDLLECRCGAVGAGDCSGRGESHEGEGRQRDLVPHVVSEVRSIGFWNELLMRIEDQRNSLLFMCHGGY